MPITGRKAGTAQGVRRKIWSLPQSLETNVLVADLEKVFQVRPEKDLARVRKWFDTDDWRLYRRNLLLFQERRQWHLMYQDSEELLAVFSGGKCEMFRNSNDFPVSRMRTLLEPILAIRAVQPLVTQDTSTVCRRILNNDRKTVALVYFEDHIIRETGAVFRSVILEVMRGYDGNFKDISSFFTACGITDEVPPHGALIKGLHGIGRAPLDYSSRFRVDLLPNMTAREAMVRIYRQLLEAIEHNEQGVVGDPDTEFLHDFRVAVRRTRSGLGQVKEVLPPDIVEKVKKDFSWLGTITGATRDLDVFLLERETYTQRLPEELRFKLDIFFADMAKRRTSEQKKLVKYLHAKKFREMIGHWHAYLHGSDLGGKTRNSERPIADLAREIISRRYKRVLKRGKSIRHGSSAEELHRLRIQCKKLRYSLEFFTSLFPAAEIEPAVKQLKKLQDNLGTFNDLSVQQEVVRQYLSGLRAGSRKSLDLATALGGLLTDLHHQRQSARKGFSAKFHHFAGEENLLRYEKLFC